MFRSKSAAQSAWTSIPLIAVISAALTGCAGGPPQRPVAFYSEDPGPDKAVGGAAVGGAVGAVTGALVGRNNGGSGTGALIGAATGALAGGLLGNHADKREHRDAAVRQAQFEQHALTNFELIRMTQSGLSDEVIVNAVSTEGGRFDLSPNGLIMLKQNGVSDAVIAGVQRAAAGPIDPVTYVEPVVVEPPPVVFVRPRPRPGLHLHVGPGRPRGRCW
ncbi:YMGG-like glycine zipper-containing protein [Stratiformator vulcanicus]|nr:glycine zipper domain-containing protein [Stratiformator vulcanicus]